MSVREVWVYRDSEHERLQVYFGFEIIEALPDVPESPACKLLLARLYNAGVKVKSLTETFGFEAKTNRRWGQSLRRGDAQDLIRVLEGRAHRRQCTPQIEAFVRLRLPTLAQWLSSLLLAAQNIEQTKFLNWEDWELILGQVIRFPLVQRAPLKAPSTAATLDGLWAFNAEILAAGVGADLYFDPHTKHSTGEQNVPKGGCAKLRWADKVLQSDFSHTAGGAPLYFETTDSCEDRRARFFGVIARARRSRGLPNQR